MRPKGSLPIVALLFEVILVAIPTESHVALTFPPAREYALDFLDNSRTKAPCGMPKGDIRTSFLSGSKFNVTWHLGYPHKGGFKIQLLDELERPVLDLTPTIQGSDFVSSDSTAQSFHVQLPSDFTCSNCTLRLLRQALEWGPNYKFWSCADVTIKTKKEFRETCSNHGRYILGRCKCDSLYYGMFCENRNECLEDSDCGSHGRCVDIQATNAPRMQCYCQLGWYGPGCNRRSPVKDTSIDFDLYTERKLSDTYRLYWRLLKEHKEIEVVMVVNGTSYVGLGWRSRSLTKTCKNFPSIGVLTNSLVEESPTITEPAGVPPFSEPEPEPNREPEPTNEPEPTSEPSSEPKSTTTLKSKIKKSLYSRRSAVSPPPPPPPHLPVRTFQPNADVVETSVSFKVSTKQGRNRRAALGEPVSEPEVEATPEPFTTISIPSSEPTAEPKLDRKFESKFESDPNSEPEPKPKSEKKMEPKSLPEPAPDPKTEPEPEPEPEPKTVKTSFALETTPSVGKKENLNTYTPRHDFNPMDCTDIVIGSARGSVSRIADYYTRDRSTPKMDSFWGGKDDLTAAMGFETDGITTILFRKKIEATETSDHSIEDDLMHVIFAQGQEAGKYVHVPKSGIEDSKVSDKDFYKQDELKYHGHRSQRGVTAINFFDEKRKSSFIITAPAQERNRTINNKEKSSFDPSECGGEFRFPRNCNPLNGTCEYTAKWDVLQNDEIRFFITTSHINLWTGIAFSDNEKMSQTDAILGWVDKNGRPFLMDTWITGYTQPFLDSSQEIFNSQGRIVDGKTQLSFTRKRISNDPKDLSFTDEHCLFMMFPVKGGIVNKKIRRHEITPVVTPERICIKSCWTDNGEVAVTTEAPALVYVITVKIVDLGENFILPQFGSLQYDDLSTSINDNFKPIFKKISGFRRAILKDLKEEKNDLVANINFEIDKAMTEKGRSLSEGSGLNDEQIHKILQESVGSGKVGNLKVDPTYLIFEPLSLTSNIIPDTSSGQDDFFKLSEAKLYIVLGCIAALILVAVVQASCTIYRATSKSSSSHKDHLIPNSAWKDYSAANTNYAFDAFEDEKKQQSNGKGRSETLPPTKHRIQRPQSRSPGVPHQHLNYMGDTRSLQRPREAYAGNLERSTFSLPRTTYDRQKPTSDMQPDFYFMPSQRKYSGEVVRVYVDYNNQLK